MLLSRRPRSRRTKPAVAAFPPVGAPSVLMEISPRHLRFLYQGTDPNAGGDYDRLPWRPGLPTQTNSPC
ncbi:hypothetical protein AB0K14_28580 [Actinosynnema sp. NPDC050801]|uniref:hypothetical protein n=1 Tax=unclassified Actinosynnema TaxID=2637065 RepID=UPI00340D2C51